MLTYVPGWISSEKDFQSPRHRGLAAEKLLVEVIPETADRLRENDARRDRIAERRQRDVTTPAGDPRAYTAQRDGPPDSEATVPDTQRRSGSGAALTEVGPPIGCQVVQPATDQPERHGPQSDVVDHPALTAARYPPSITDQQGSDDPDDDEERVGP